MTVFLLKDDNIMNLSVLHFDLSFQRLEFDYLFGVVTTTPKGALHAISPFGIPVASNSEEHSITN